jgi:hypothetical protein
MFGTNSAAARWCERGEARRSPISAATMGVFVIACPQTGKKFATGIQVERDDLADTDATTVATSFCPHCRQIHKWCYGDAEYVDALPPRDWIANG